jgi:tetratricopeptide (TPR) repeat protein
MDTTDRDLDEELDALLDVARGLLAQNEEVEDLWEANELAGRAITLRPLSSDAWLVKAQALSSMGDDFAALACIEKSVRLDAGSAEARYWEAAVLADLERYDDALAAVERTFEVLAEQDDWLLEEAYYEKAIILDAMGDRDGALDTFRAGLERFPDSPVLKAGLEPIQRDRVRRSFKVIEGGLR